MRYLMIFVFLICSNVHALTIGVFDAEGWHGDTVCEIIKRVNPEAKIVRINVLDGFYSTLDKIEKRIIEASKKHKFDRINLSLSDGRIYYTKVEGSMYETFKKLGIEVYAAAGNRRTPENSQEFMSYPAADKLVNSVTCPPWSSHAESIVIKESNWTSYACAIACASGGVPAYKPANIEIEKVKVGRKRARITLTKKYFGTITLWIGNYFFKDVKVRGRKIRLWVPKFKYEPKDNNHDRVAIVEN